MITPARKAKVSALDNKIEILSANGIDCPQAQPIFLVVTNILALLGVCSSIRFQLQISNVAPPGRSDKRGQRGEPIGDVF